MSPNPSQPAEGQEQSNIVTLDDLERSLETGRTPVESTDFSAFKVDVKNIEIENAANWKQIRQFYVNQNDYIERIEEISNRVNNRDGSQEQDREERARASSLASCAVQLSFAMNVLLFGAKLFVAVASGSLVVIASALDSFLDLISGFVLSATERAIHRADPHNKYPEGKHRMEPVGVVAFASIMGMSSLLIVMEAGKSIVFNFNSPPNLDVDASAYAILASTVGVKFMLWMYCNWVLRQTETKGASASVEAYAQDHLMDCFCNTFGLAALVIAVQQESLWWFDPAGAIGIGIWILVNWVQAGFEQMECLVGLTAGPSQLSLLTYIAFHHDQRIRKVDTVRAYHHGARYLAEVHVVLPEDMSVREAHDIAEGLEKSIEKCCPEVERAFVHIDYEWSHKPEYYRRVGSLKKTE